MNKNVGTIDRVARVILGLALLAFALGFIGKGSPYAWLGWIGIVPILTAVFSFCPAYTLLGMSTCPMGAKKS
jgi:Na+/proline symporter